MLVLQSSPAVHNEFACFFLVVDLRFRDSEDFSCLRVLNDRYISESRVLYFFFECEIFFIPTGLAVVCVFQSHVHDGGHYFAFHL